VGEAVVGVLSRVCLRALPSCKSFDGGKRKQVAKTGGRVLARRQVALQCVGPACSPLVYQQKIMILKQRRELAGVHLGCSNRVFARAAH
jgi:hypothetical protein